MPGTSHIFTHIHHTISCEMGLIIPPYNNKKNKTKTKTKQDLPRSHNLCDSKIPTSFLSKTNSPQALHCVDSVVKIQQIIQKEVRTDLLIQSKMYDYVVTRNIWTKSSPLMEIFSESLHN